jgi:hypothetical protein
MICLRGFSTITPDIRNDIGCGRNHAAGMDDDIPVVVRMRVEWVRWRAQDETLEFDMQHAKAQPREESVPGKCAKCGAPVRMDLKRTQQVQ